MTGAAIGRATALGFAGEGASVVVADISEQVNQETARMIEKLGGRALAVRCNVTRSEDVKAALDQAVDAFGRLDIAFNNAGAEQEPKPTAEMTEQEWDRIIAINLRSVFVCMNYEIPLMLEHGGGAIVNNSSGAGIRSSTAATRCSSRAFRSNGSLSRLPGRCAAVRTLGHPSRGAGGRVERTWA